MVKVVEKTSEGLARQAKASRLSSIARGIFTGEDVEVTQTSDFSSVAIFPEGRKMRDLRTCGAYVLVSSKFDQVMVYDRDYETQALELAKNLEKEFGVEYTMLTDYSTSS
jgi:hypothetical protein